MIVKIYIKWLQPPANRRLEPVAFKTSMANAANAVNASNATNADYADIAHNVII